MGHGPLTLSLQLKSLFCQFVLNVYLQRLELMPEVRLTQAEFKPEPHGRVGRQVSPFCSVGHISRQSRDGLQSWEQENKGSRSGEPVGTWD